MDFTPTHPLQPFWEIAAAPIQVQALEFALDRGLFEMLDVPSGAGEIASRLDLNEQAIGPWLDLLWSLGLLSHAPSVDASIRHYVASPPCRRFFTRGSADYCGDAWLYRARFLRRFAEHMPKLLDGSAADDENGVAAPMGSWAQAAQAQIDQEQRGVTVPAVLEIMDRLGPLAPAGRFLDLGGGPGHVGIALAHALPNWSGAIGDLPETVAVARANIANAALDERVEAIACDLDEDAIAGRYDLIWCSSVLHFLAQPKAAFARIHAALNPGGRLLIAHGEIAGDAALAARVLPFYVPMMLRGKYVPRPGEIAAMMEAAGFDLVQALGRSHFPMAPATLYTGRRAG